MDVRPDACVASSDQDVFDATARLCASVGWEFRLLGDLPAVYLANVRWLAGYRHSRCLCSVESGTVLEALASKSALTIHELAKRVGDRVAVLPAIFHLLWQQRLRTDLKSRPLHLGSSVWLDEAA